MKTSSVFLLIVASATLCHANSKATAKALPTIEASIIQSLTMHIEHKIPMDGSLHNIPLPKVNNKNAPHYVKISGKWHFAHTDAQYDLLYTYPNGSSDKKRHHYIIFKPGPMDIIAASKSEYLLKIPAGHTNVKLGLDFQKLVFDYVLKPSTVKSQLKGELRVSLYTKPNVIYRQVLLGSLLTLLLLAIFAVYVYKRRRVMRAQKAAQRLRQLKLNYQKLQPLLKKNPELFAPLQKKLRVLLDTLEEQSKRIDTIAAITQNFDQKHHQAALETTKEMLANCESESEKQKLEQALQAKQSLLQKHHDNVKAVEKAYAAFDRVEDLLETALQQHLDWVDNEQKLENLLKTVQDEQQLIDGIKKFYD